MIRACIAYVVSLSLLFGGARSLAQNNISSPEFFHHLKSNNLFTEQIYFLDQLVQNGDGVMRSDTLQLHRSACLQLLGDTALSSGAIDRISPTPKLNSSHHPLYLSLLFIKGKHGRIEKYLSSLDKQEESVRIANILLSLQKRKPAQMDHSDSILFQREDLNRFLKLYAKVPKKSAFTAGLLSAVIPGMGKLYAGYRNQFFSALFTNVVFAGQATEAYLKSGPKSAHFIYAASLFGVYYFGNIAGSAWAVKKKKRDTLREIDYEISEYYSSAVNGYAN